MGQIPYLQQRLIHPRTDNSSTAMHSKRKFNYYSTRTIYPFPTKELLVLETTSKSTTTVLEEMIQDSRRQASWKGNQPTGRQMKGKKSTIHHNDKSTQVDSYPHKSQEDITINCSRLWCRLQATNNLISDGFYLRNILRESLLWAANGNPITNKGQVRGRDKGLN